MPATTQHRTSGRRAADHETAERLRELTAATQKIREQDRTRIARELHDDPGQLLAAVRLDVNFLLRNSGLDEATREVLERVDERVHESIATLRRIAAALRPHSLDQGGLYMALQGLVKDFCRRSAIHCALYADEDDLQFTDDEFNTAIYRIVQEALNNALRHSEAQSVTTSLYRVDHQILLTVLDDGRGIEHGDLEKPGSLGLLGMRERVLALGGDISIAKDNGSGTRIDVTLPLPHDGADELLPAPPTAN